MITVLPLYRNGIYSAQDKKTARASVFFTAVLVLLFSLVPTLTGMAAAVVADRDGAVNILQIPERFRVHFGYGGRPVRSASLFVLMALSTVVCGGGFLLLSCADILTNNICMILSKKNITTENYRLLSKSAVVIMTAAAFILSFESIAATRIQEIGSILIPSLGVMVLSAKMFGSVKWQAATAGLVSGCAVGTVCLFGQAGHTGVFWYLGNRRFRL